MGLKVPGDGRIYHKPKVFLALLSNDSPFANHAVSIRYASTPRLSSTRNCVKDRQVLSLITCKHNVQQKSYWTRRQERVKLDDYRRSRTDLTSRGRQWSVPNRLPDFDNDMSASSRIEDSHPGQSPREDPMTTLMQAGDQISSGVGISHRECALTRTLCQPSLVRSPRPFRHCRSSKKLIRRSSPNGFR